MIRWLNLDIETESNIGSQADQIKRFQLLSEVLNHNGVENEVVHESISAMDLAARLPEYFQTFQQIRVSSSSCDEMRTLMSRAPSMTMSLKVCDAFVHEADGWWPRCFLYEAMQVVVAKHVTGLDFTGGVFVIGAGAMTRAVVGALVRVGFEKINITDPDEYLAQELIEDLQRTFFGVQFQFTKKQMVTQLPGVHSVAVNTIVGTDTNPELSEIFYLNFLKAGGAWIDLNLSPVESNLSAEARTVGAQVVNGVKVASITDCLWVKKAFALDLDESQYSEILRQSFVSEADVKERDPSVLHIPQQNSD